VLKERLCSRAVLSLAGEELNFFIVASMGLCFEFVLQTVLIIQGCVAIAEQFLHSVKAFSAPRATPAASRLGICKRLGGNTARTADPD